VTPAEGSACCRPTLGCRLLSTHPPGRGRGAEGPRWVLLFSAGTAIGFRLLRLQDALESGHVGSVLAAAQQAEDRAEQPVEPSGPDVRL